jgi:hypothetical protein
MIGLSVNIKVIGTPEAVRFIENKVDDLEMKLAEQIVIESRRLIDESTPTGRLYRRKAFGRGAVRGLGVRASGPGRRFHRASAPGQPPAKDTGKLYRDIKAFRTGRGKVRVKFGAPYAGYLEFNLNRPFILPAIERAVDKVFNQ